MSSKLIEIVTMEAIAVLFFVFAWQIGIKGRLELIAGYNKRSADRVKDKPGLGRLVARCCLVVGIASALMPLLTHLAAGSASGFAHVVGGYGGLIVGVVAMVVLQARDYTA